MTDLRTAAQQALEALEDISNCYVGEHDECGECASCHESSYKPHRPDCKKNSSITALRAALAQQAEPVRELLISAAAMAVAAERKGVYPGASCVADAVLETVPPAQRQAEPDAPERRCGGPGCDGTCCQPVAKPVAQPTRAQRMRDAGFTRRPTVREMAQQDEPVTPYAWMAVGGTIWRHKTREDDVPLYTAPPQRKPLTEEEIWRKYQSLWPFHPADEPKLAADIVAFTRDIERAHGIGGDDGQA